MTGVSTRCFGANARVRYRRSINWIRIALDLPGLVGLFNWVKESDLSRRDEMKVPQQFIAGLGF